MYEDLKKMVMSRKLKDAIEKVSDFLIKESQTDYLNTITILSSQNASLEQDKMSGILRPDDEAVQRARITSRFLGLLDQMKDDGILLAASQKSEKSTSPSQEDLCLHYTELTRTLTEKLIFYKKDLTLASDPGIRFQLSKAIEQTEKELQEAKQGVQEHCS